MRGDERKIVEAVATAADRTIQAVVHTLPNTRPFDRVHALLAIASASLNEAQRVLRSSFTEDSANDLAGQLRTIEDTLDDLLCRVAEG